MSPLYGKWPGVVRIYDGAARMCRVEIPGITDGSSELPEATLCNPLGDRPGETEIRIEVGDLVWLEFEAGDPRFPIITGYRTPRAGNPVDWRRWAHANIELTAEGQMIFNAETLVINAKTTINGQTDVNGQTSITGETTITGDTSVIGAMSNNGVSTGSSHTHPIGAGATSTGTPTT